MLTNALPAKLRQALPTAHITLYKEAGRRSPTALKSCLIHVFCTEYGSVRSMPFNLPVPQHGEALSFHIRHQEEITTVLSALRGKLPQPQGLALKPSPQCSVVTFFFFVQCKIPTYPSPIYPSPWKEIHCKQPASRGGKGQAHSTSNLTGEMSAARRGLENSAQASMTSTFHNIYEPWV